MKRIQHSRPWYAYGPAVDEWSSALRNGSDFRVLKAFKLLRATVVNVGVAGIALFALSLGGDPTILGSLGIMTLALYNGVELADYAALVQALAEVSSPASADQVAEMRDDGDGDT